MKDSTKLLPSLLISVRSAEEAEIALEGGAGIIDIKEPASGVLGAAPLNVIREIVKCVDGRRPVSATVGDIPLNEAVAASEATAATGVDYVKIGAFPGGDAAASLMALKPQADRGTKLIFVMFADMEPDFGLVKVVAEAGFKGVMLDTAKKGQGNLCTALGDEQLGAFLAEARSTRMMAGLAGSLRLDDIAPLMTLRPDVLGFRGAACLKGTREDALDAAAVAALWYTMSQVAVSGERGGMH
jgi:(5-formylfuran-3-yl)methyl phosphate synthase